MICYLYDGSFEDLLTCIYEAYYNKLKPENIVRDCYYVQTLITQPLYIATDNIKANKVYLAIKNKISKEPLQWIFYTYLSDTEGAEDLIYSYVKLGFQLGENINLHLHNQIVINMLKLYRKVSFESHRMLGLIRFKCIGKNMYYAPLEPDHNIIGVIANHFALRLSDQNFIIHDLKREIAVIYNTKKWVLTSFIKEDGLNSKSQKYRKLCCNHFFFLHKFNYRICSKDYHKSHDWIRISSTSKKGNIYTSKI